MEVRTKNDRANCRRPGLPTWQEAFAGLKKLAVPPNDKPRDVILKKFPMAKFDSATTRSIELVPREAKDNIFDMVVAKKTLDVMDAFLASI